MKLIQPFRGLRPPPELAQAVSAPPYDVINRKEAKVFAAGNPHSFLHVSKAEIDLPEHVESGDPLVYETARRRLESMVRSGFLLADSEPCLYLYRLEMAQRQQLGLVATASVNSYQSGRIKKHEFTRPDKEEDRTRLALSLQAHTGPVFLIHRPNSGVHAATQAAMDGAERLYDFTGGDAIRHTFWRIPDPVRIADLVNAFEALDYVYIADGHHRSAAAVRVCEGRRNQPDPPPWDASVNRFLSVLFPSDQVRILDYNRVVRDLHGYTPESFLDALRTRFFVSPATDPVKPQTKRCFGLYLRQVGWFRLEIKPEVQLSPDSLPQDRLDVSLLSQHLLEPILGIHDPRRDSRIDFVGGIRGMEGLMNQVDANEMAAGFSLCPTDLEELMLVADADQVMPPKSTWFEPKLRDGLIIQTF
ncbi:MAG: Uncharacterized conserved protein UCP033563 [Magnetococcales bacterium]|nr:Uncharacterized conserved protein UCP033563 [Magnetococcales bacterium]HIJ83516.1 DUF1015 domain-containing protein [Magnetococcales bacterium]